MSNLPVLQMNAIRLEMALRSHARVHAWLARTLVVTCLACLAYAYSIYNVAH